MCISTARKVWVALLFLPNPKVYFYWRAGVVFWAVHFSWQELDFRDSLKSGTIFASQRRTSDTVSCRRGRHAIFHALLQRWRSWVDIKGGFGFGDIRRSFSVAQVQHPVNLDDVCDIVVSLGLGHHHAFALQAQYFSWQVQGRFFFATVTWFFSHSSNLTRKSGFFLQQSPRRRVFCNGSARVFCDGVHMQYFETSLKNDRFSNVHLVKFEHVFAQPFRPFCASDRSCCGACSATCEIARVIISWLCACRIPLDAARCSFGQCLRCLIVTLHVSVEITLVVSWCLFLPIFEDPGKGILSFLRVLLKALSITILREFHRALLEVLTWRQWPTSITTAVCPRVMLTCILV